MKTTSFARNAALSLALCALASFGTGQAAHADSIGISFIGDNASVNTLSTLTSAGVVPQTNWNNLAGFSGTSGALNDNTGAATTTTLTYAAGNAASFNSAAGGDEQLNNGVIFSNPTAANTFTLNNISYASYDIYVYNLSVQGSEQKTTLGSTSFYSTSPNPTGAGYIDVNSTTPYIYTPATSTVAGVFTPNANYVRFSGLSGASQTFSVTGLNNLGVVGGIQVTQVAAVPEPSTWAMMFLGMGAVGVAMRRKRQSVAEDSEANQSLS